MEIVGHVTFLASHNFLCESLQHECGLAYSLPRFAGIVRCILSENRQS